MAPGWDGRRISLSLPNNVAGNLPGTGSGEEGRREVVKRGEVGSLSEDSELGREKAALSLRSREEGTEREGEGRQTGVQAGDYISRLTVL